jgi:hypothetical protein
MEPTRISSSSSPDIIDLIPRADHDAMGPAGIPSGSNPPLIGFAPEKRLGCNGKSQGCNDIS